MPPVLELEGVGVRFGNQAELLSDIGLVLLAGSVTIVTGSRGAGKSLLLDVAALARRPSRGGVRLFGEPVSDRPAAWLAALRRRIGLAESAPALVPGLDAVGNVALSLRLGGMAREDARRHATELLDWLGGAAGSAAISPDQGRRIGLARAIVGDPGLVLVDDAERLGSGMLGCLSMLIERLGRRGTAFLLASADERLARDIAGATWLRLEAGRLRAIDRPAAAPLHPVRA